MDKIEFVQIENIGLFFPNFFNETNYFELIENSHNFQKLTESNKKGNAYRKGIYLSKVEKENDKLLFNLLRCSTNFEGPTDNFRDVDINILDKVNKLREKHFKNSSEFNHILAQIYTNVKIDDKEKKAKIKQHSDKTKDMPENGLIAFCTFYKNIDCFEKCKVNENDYVYKNTSVLTKLRFKLKNCVKDENLIKTLDLTLYPNSLFIIPLSTNRLYTHEIIPSILPIDKIPIRMGYVIRCSNTKAIYTNEQTYIKDQSNNFEKLKFPNEENIVKLKELYLQENVSDDTVIYPSLNFSLNEGDYKQPIL